MNCEGIITQALGESCKNHPFGFEREAIIINRGHVNFGDIVYASNSTNIVTDMPLVRGVTGYKVTQYGTKPFNGTKKSGVIKESAPGKVTKTVQFFVSDHDPEVDEKFIDAILNGEFVMILENKDKNESDNNAAFEIYGMQNGLHLTAIEQDNYGDYGSGWLVTMEETEAPSSSIYLFDTNYAATKAKFNAYLVASS